MRAILRGCARGGRARWTAGSEASRLRNREKIQRSPSWKMILPDYGERRRRLSRNHPLQLFRPPIEVGWWIFFLSWLFRWDWYFSWIFSSFRNTIFDLQYLISRALCKIRIHRNLQFQVQCLKNEAIYYLINSIFLIMFIKSTHRLFLCFATLFV